MNNILALLILLESVFSIEALVKGALNQVFTKSPEERITIHFQPIFKGKKITLNEPSEKDIPSLQVMRFYLSNFVFLKNGAVAFEEKNSYHLLDLEDENTLVLKFDAAQNLDFDHLKFNLGIDSLIHISGAMGGDLDPTKGMFWTWQSGYVNFKLEGVFEKCPSRNHEFQFHLGGYLTPFQSVQRVSLSAPKGGNLQLQLDLTPFFDQIDWAKQYSIMSPSKEAVTLSKILANSFSVHAK
ncbi:MAG: hypothetical protein H7246_07915 [Phycisphaerae bacterium]|nr:hypothetical protein [Saprospiraceae bacterium]